MSTQWQTANLSNNHKADSSTLGTNGLLAVTFWDLPQRTFEL